MEMRETLANDQIIGNLAIIGIVLMCIGFLVWIYAKDLTLNLNKVVDNG